MCKIFFSFHYPNSKQLLIDFLHQGNTEHLEYGYGIASWNNKWSSYKCNCFHMTDPNSKKILKEIDSSILLSHIRNIYHEDMTPIQICNELKIENIHPFQFKEYIFMHHGDLFLKYEGDLHSFQLGQKSRQFKNAIKEIKKHILPNLRKNILGKTDSEILFYLLISLQKKIMDDKQIDTKQSIIESFHLISLILESNGISNSSNIIFSNSEFIFVAKIYKNNSDMKLKNPDLFLLTNKKNLLFSNYKLKEDMKLIDKNTLYIIPINKKHGNLEFHTL
jgi:predicted glutamine amidotransferase